MKAELSSVCDMVPQESSKPRQTLIRSFFGARTSASQTPVSLRAVQREEDRDTSGTDRTKGSLHDSERNVAITSSSELWTEPLEHRVRTRTEEAEPSATRRITKRKNVSTQQQQLYLDFGQRNFAVPIICATCGMLMVHGVAADVQRHQSVCRNYKEGIPWNDSASLKPCWEWTLAAKRGMKKTRGMESLHRDSTKRSCVLRDLNGSSPERACIIEILPTDRSRYSKKLKLLHSIVDQELGFVSNSETVKPFTTYLCIVNKRVVGMILVEEISAAYRVLVPESGSSPRLKFGLNRSAQPTKAVLGIYQLWVHCQHRHRGIASVMVDVARKQMVFGYAPVPVHQVAFSSPTESGLSFAKHYYSVRGDPSMHRPHSLLDDNTVPENDVLVYDCG